MYTVYLLNIILLEGIINYLMSIGKFGAARLRSSNINFSS